MKKLHLGDMEEELDNVTEWMVSLLVWLLVVCMIGLIVLLVLFGV